MCERRPSASRMPIGSDATMPTAATTRVISMPPHSEVSTMASPSGGSPYSRNSDTIGKMPKK